MIITKLKILNFYNIINFLLALLPLSFIAGNLLINLNITLIVLSSLSFWKINFFKIKINYVDKFLITLFIFSLVTGLINLNEFSSYDTNLAKENIFKTIAYFRYLLFYFSLRHIIENDFFNFKIFFLSSSFCIVFVAFDLILQQIRGADIFGFKKIVRDKLSGPFGDELIAGSYLQRFGIFLFFLFPFLKNKFNNKILNIFIIFLFSLIFYSILISGNRMPLLLFLLSILILPALEKSLRKIFFIIIPISLLILFTVYTLDNTIADYINHFFNRSFEIIFNFNVIFNDLNFNMANGYLKEFHLGYLTWQENVFLGGGINSFYLNCKINFNICTTHPHNYYLEILSELGIVGLLLLLIIFINLFHSYFKVQNKLNINTMNVYLTPFLTLFIVEIFPIKTTGSFFTTGNATFFFLLIAVIVGMVNKLKYN